MPTTEEFKLILDIHSFREVVEVIFQDVNSRLRQVESLNLELKLSLEYTQKEVEDVKRLNKALQDEVNNLIKKISKKSDVEDKFLLYETVEPRKSVQSVAYETVERQESSRKVVVPGQVPPLHLPPLQLTPLFLPQLLLLLPVLLLLLWEWLLFLQEIVLFLLPA
ncbi:hypothetical protein Pcinc_008641 [Petrolisthes cinctipes]|uniref:Uncharacterized protein n=1 Tax=Petrolisthes cinctipes TaxID=88211 RepID=A0AAE1KZ93_PETCI|nr:hypothetical protein Pcinc_008641 [Petrolisthes cinctipes]